VLAKSDGTIEAVIVDQGGTLGMGGRQVAITWDQIKIQGDQITVNMAADQLEQLPDYAAE
jgi:hypothetical protein